METPARSNALGKAFAGAVVNHSGSCAASAYPLIVAKGVKPSSLAFSSLINMTAAAPSLIVEALAAVTVPSLENAGLSAGTFSSFTFLNSSSSLTIIGSPRR